MDAIRKKMQSLKSETDQLYSTIMRHETTVKEANAKNDAQGLIKNITPKQPTAASKEAHQGRRILGRKLGLPESSSNTLTMLTIPN